MQRRKFLIGAASIAAGSGAALGTGAFTQVNADRNVDVNVAADANAYLKLDYAYESDGEGGTQKTANSDAYVTSDPSSGALEIQLDSDNGTTDLGSGVNPNADTQIDDVFSIANNGTQTVDVYIDDGSESAVAFNVVPVGGGSETDISGTSPDGSGGTTQNTVTLGVGDSVNVDMDIDSTGESVGSLLDTVTVHANA